MDTVWLERLARLRAGGWPVRTLIMGKTVVQNDSHPWECVGLHRRAKLIALHEKEYVGLPIGN